MSTTIDINVTPTIQQVTINTVDNITVINVNTQSGGGIQTIVAGTNVTVDNTDPLNPIISATGGGGGVPTLDQVLTEGNTSDKSIILDEGAGGFRMAMDFGSTIISITENSSGNLGYLSESGMVTRNATNTIFGEYGKGYMQLKTTATSGIANIKGTNLTSNRNYELPNASGTIALTSDIPTIDATPTDGSANAVSSNGVFDALATKVSKSDYTPAHSILVQQSGTGSPTALQVGNNTLVGRVSGGGSDIDDLSTSQVRTMLSINNVDNTSDANKPVSTATQTALDLKADKSSTPNIVIRNITPSTALTGTTIETQITSFNFTIPANTFSASDILKIETIAWEKSGTANASTCRIKLSNTNNYAGASNVLILAASAGNINMRGTRTYKIAGGNLKGFMSSSANGIFNDNTLSSVAVSTLALDVTQPIYGFVSLTNSSSADSTIVNELIISKW
jgi:hypothetical protein